MAIRYLSGINVDSNTLFVDDVNNRVGIGTGSPTTILAISQASPIVTINSSDASQFHGIEFRNGNTLDAFIKQLPQTSEFRISNGRGASWGGHITFYTDTVERMRINSAGNVGIGTTSPFSRVQVSDSVTGDAGITIHNNSEAVNNSAAVWFKVASSASDYRKGAIFFSNNGTGHGRGSLFFATNNSANSTVVTASDARMTITSAGDVGIGTTSPSYKLDISTFQSIRVTGASTGYTQGSIIFQSSTTDSPGARGLGVYLFNEGTDATWFYGTGYSAADTFVINRKSGATYQDSAAAPAESSNFFAITNAGNVGIGTTSPSQLLHIYGSAPTPMIESTTVGANANLRFKTTARTWSIGPNQALTNSFFEIYDSTASATRVTIDTSGNVGIGTTSPAQKLHVDGKIYAKPYLPVVLSGSGDPYYGTNLTLAADIGQTQGAVRIWSRYNAGGTATMTFEISSTDQAYNQDPQLLTYSEKMRITSAGNVGIGTTSPGTKLDVNGGSDVTVAKFYNLSATATQVEIGDSGNSQYSNLLLLSNSGQAEIWKSGTGYTSYGGALALNIYNSNGPIAFHPNNTVNAMTIANTGNVGIGTTSPTFKLEVNAGSNAGMWLQGTSDARYHVFSSSSQDWVGYELRSSNVNTFAGGIFRQNSSNNRVSLYNKNTEAISLMDTGKVGIGTTSPQSKVQISYESNHTTGDISVNESALDLYNTLAADTDEKGSIITFSDNYFDGNYQKTTRAAIKGGTDQTGNTAAGFLAFYTDSSSANSATERMRITSSGNVGIGTTSPAIIGTGITSLDIQGSNAGGIAFGPSGTKNYIYGASTMYVEAHTTAVFVTSGTEKMRLTTGGQLIVGGTTVGYAGTKLQVGNTSDSQNGLNILTSTTGYGYILFGDGAGADTYVGTIGYKHGDDYMYFNTNGSERMRIASTGATRLNAYGSGSFTGTVAYNLAVDSSGNIIETAGGVVDGSGTANYVSKWQDANTLTNSVLYDDGTDVGIGTTSPAPYIDGGAARGLQINNAGRAGIRLHDTGGVVQYFDIGINGSTAFISAIYSQTPDIKYQAYSQHIFETNSSERMRITSAGNVGIGTTSPSAPLHVYKSAAAGDYVAYIQNTGAGNGLKIYNADWDITDYLLYATNGGTAANGYAFVVDGNGRVGIGTTSPSSLLDVYNGSGWGAVDIDGTSGGEIRLQKNGTTYGNLYASDNSSTAFVISAAQVTDLILQTNSSERLRITSSGNVGIGTTSPTFKLDVNGTGRFISTTAANGSPSAGSFYSGDDSSSIWRAAVTIQHNSDTTIVAGSSIGIVLSPLASTGSNFYGHASIKAVRPNATANNQNTDLSFWTRAGASNSTTDTEKMRITADGQLIIGATSMTYNNGTLGYVAGFRGAVTSQAFIGIAKSNQTLGDQGMIVGLDATTGYVWLRDNINLTFGTNDSAKVTILAGGNVGIGTTSPQTGVKLDVYGAAAVAGGSEGLRIGSVGDNSAYDNVKIYYSGYNSGTPRVYLTPRTTPGSGVVETYFHLLNTNGASTTSNNTMGLLVDGIVGIGNTAPSQKLHVTGNIRVTGAYYDSNNSAGSSGQVLSSTGSGTDWVSLSEITGVDGTGTANYIAKWSDTDTITNSSITDNGSTVTANVDRLNMNKQAGIYTFSKTLGATVASDFFSISNNHGAQAFRVTFVCSSSGYSVAKTYEVVHAYGQTPIYFKVVDTGPYGSEDFDVAFTDSNSSTGVKATVTNNSATTAGNIVATVFLGGGFETITVTAL